MYADPYWCSICDVTFSSEKASYEHDVSIEHHSLYEKYQKSCGRPTVHYCSICDRGGITSLDTWTQHCKGKGHAKAVEHFNQFYQTQYCKLDAFSNFSSREKTGSLKDKKNRKPNVASKHSKPSARRPKSQRTCKSQINSNLKHGSTDELIAVQFPLKEVVSDEKISNCTSLLDVKQDVSRQEGLMLNILESIGTQNSKVISAQERAENKQNRVANKIEQPASAQQLNLNKRKSMHSISEPVAKRAVSVSSSESITVSIDSSPKETQESSTVGDVKNMQEALVISQELEIWKRKQTELETQLHDIQTKLNEVKSKQRELKVKRNNLLRGLVRSESEDDNNGLDTSTTLSEPRSCRPLTNTNGPVIVSVNPIQSCTQMQHNQPSQQWSCSVSSSGFSTDNPKIPLVKPMILGSSVATVPSIHSSTSLSVGLVQSGPVNASSVSTHPVNAVTTSHSTPLTDLNWPSHPTLPTKSGDPVTPAINLMPSAFSASINPPVISTFTTEPPPSVTTAGPPGVDLERLALIRRALQSPDSWKFTFEDVDRMLQQTAAKAKAKQQKQTEIDETILETPTSQMTDPPEISTSFPSVNFEPNCAPPIQIKGEPAEYVNPVPSVAQPLAALIEPQVLKPSMLTPTSSSSFDSSEDENSVQRPPVHKVKRLIKPDPLGNTFPSPPAPPLRTESTSTSTSSQASERRSVSRDSVKFGEFHAFDGQTTAVIDIVVHRSSWSIFVGGQSGAVAQFDLKSHVCLRRILPRDASVTQMALDPSENSLFVGYYDNCFAEFSVATGALLFEKYFSQRVEVIAIPPMRDVSYLYLGMSNGDILRHDIGSRVVSVLHDRSLRTGPDGVSPSSAGISSMAVIQSGTRLLLIVGDQERNLAIHAASDGSYLLLIRSSPHKGPPQGIAKLPGANLFCAYSDRCVRIHNWKTGTGVMTLQTQNVTSSCVTDRLLAIGDSEGAIRVHKLQDNGLPYSRPKKVYFAGTRAAITSLVSCGEAIIAGSLDGSVTTIWVNEPTKNHVCLYGPFGHNCGIGFDRQEDLIKHVLDTHFIFGGNKSIMCRWGAGRCRVRFSDTKSIKAIRDHLLTHIPD